MAAALCADAHVQRLRLVSHRAGDCDIYFSAEINAEAQRTRRNAEFYPAKTFNSFSPSATLCVLCASALIRHSLAHFAFGSGMKIFFPTIRLFGFNPGFAFKIWSVVTFTPCARYALAMPETVSFAAIV